MRKYFLLTAMALTGLAANLSAGEKNMMHCFAYTAIEKATPAEWEAFQAASDAMPKKMKGVVKRVWLGKLQNTLAQYAVPADARKRLVAGEKEVEAKIQLRPRQYGMCIELVGHNNLKVYAEHPYHKEWIAAYEKVRVPGTTTYDIIGQ